MSATLSLSERQARRRRGRPPAGAPSLTLGEIVAGGDALLRDAGWAALSMRTLAARLGVDAMALYRHVASRDALLTAIAATRFRALDPDRLRFRSGTSWQQRLHHIARVYFRCVRGVPELVRALTASADAAAAVTTRWRAQIAEILSGVAPTRAFVWLVADTMADLVHGIALAADGGSERALRRSLTLVIAGIEAQRADGTRVRQRR